MPANDAAVTTTDRSANARTNQAAYSSAFPPADRSTFSTTNAAAYKPTEHSTHKPADGAAISTTDWSTVQAANGSAIRPTHLPTDTTAICPAFNATLFSTISTTDFSTVSPTNFTTHKPNVTTILPTHCDANKAADQSAQHEAFPATYKPTKHPAYIAANQSNLSAIGNANRKPFEASYHQQTNPSRRNKLSLLGSDIGAHVHYKWL